MKFFIRLFCLMLLGIYLGSLGGYFLIHHEENVSIIEIIHITPEKEKILKPIEFNNSDVKWLALNIYYESRSQSLKGMMGVAFVTINRVHHKRFPNTIKKVVQQKSQFSWYKKDKIYKPKNVKIWQLSLDCANLVLFLNNDNKKPKHDWVTDGSLYYYAYSGRNRIKEPWWVKGENMTKAIDIGDHRFLKLPRKG